MKDLSNIIFLAFIALGWAGIVQRLKLAERTSRIADGNIDGHRYSIIQRENKLYILFTDLSSRNKCREAVGKILQILNPKAEVKVENIGYASTHCNYCLESITFPYRCRRCGGWYCQDHRFPEEHNCPSSGEAKVAILEVDSKRARVGEKEEIIVVEIPCG